MKRHLWAALGWLALLVTVPACFGGGGSYDGGQRGNLGRHGATGLWVLANISYAGMRAQSHPSVGWRILAFIFGFPGTLVSWLAVQEGSCRAYGVSLTRPRPGNSDIASWQSPAPPADSDTPG